MTAATKGVQKALARAGASVVAIAEMTTEDLIAQMNDDQKASLVAALAPAADPAKGAKAADHKEPDQMEPDDDEDDGKCKDKSGAKKKPACEDGGAKASDPRVKAVAAAVASDDACKGKADLALAMLADDDYAGLSASGIVKLLGKQPASGASATDPEAAARAEMQAAIADNRNSNVDANGGGSPGGDKKADASAVWARARANVYPNQTK